MPGVLKVKLNVPPLDNVPLLKSPVSDVTVCDVESWFCQITVDPTVMVTDEGEKAKS